MRKLLSFALAFVTFVCLCAPTQFIVGSHAQSDAQTAQRLADRAIGQTPLMNDLRELCDQIGGRPTGSPACGPPSRGATRPNRAAPSSGPAGGSFFSAVRVHCSGGRISPGTGTPNSRSM